MKQLPILFAVVAISLSLCIPSAIASQHDPSKPLPWLMKENTTGDETGWHDLDSNDKTAVINGIDLFKLFAKGYISIGKIPCAVRNPFLTERMEKRQAETSTVHKQK